MDTRDVVIGMMAVRRFNLTDLNRFIRLAVLNGVHPKTHRQYSVKESKIGFTNEYQTTACYGTQQSSTTTYINTYSSV